MMCMVSVCYPGSVKPGDTLLILEAGDASFAALLPLG
jgi:hypothetical protein